VFGPFVPLLRSPELMLAAEAMGNYLRYRSSLPLRISEFVILITARRWSQQLEWHIHYPVALEAGLDPEIAGAVAEGRRPDGMAADESVAWDLRANSTALAGSATRLISGPSRPSASRAQSSSPASAAITPCSL
jgi:hypothetical protein